MKISKNPSVNWSNDAIQFPRLIAELEAVGAFTPEVISDLKEAMDLNDSELRELVDRAQGAWDYIKERTSPVP